MLRAILPRAIRARHPHGQSLVEFALVLPLIIAVLVMTIDLGRVYFTYVGLRNAAREAAIYGGYHPTEPLSPCATTTYRGLRYTTAKELGKPYANVVCGSGSPDKIVIRTTGSNATGCYEFTPPSTYVACPPAPTLLTPTRTYVYRVRLTTTFRPVTPLVGLLTGNGFGGAMPLSVVTSSPVLAGYQ